MFLPLVEFAYNNAPSATTGISFFANEGYHTNLTIHPECDLISSRAKDPAVNLNELHQELKTTISKAQRHYQGHADACRCPLWILSLDNEHSLKQSLSAQPSHSKSSPKSSWVHLKF